jgi:hypothetical protein
MRSVSPGVIATTTDYGAHVVALIRSNIVSSGFDLLIDPPDPRRLFAVGTSGDVSVSGDRGRELAKDRRTRKATLSLVLGSARVSPGLPTTIYAAGLQACFN